MNSLNGESLVSTLSSIPMYYLSLFPLLGAMAWKRSYMFFCGSVWEMSKSSILWIGMGFVFLFPQGVGGKKDFSIKHFLGHDCRNIRSKGIVFGGR